jgi:F-type H+-transporting ATPase subunit b
MFRFALFLLAISNVAMAAGNGHGGGSPWDLKWAFFNTVLLFGFLGFKMKTPIKEMFDNNAKSVAELYQFANEKEKEAQVRLESLQNKMSNLQSEKDKIVKEIELDTKNFIDNSEKDLDDYLARLEKDTNAKLSTEKLTLERELNNGLVDEVIALAKTKIKSDSAMSGKISSKIMEKVN